MGFAVVGNKYRRSVAYAVGTAVNIQAGFNLIPYINGHFGGAIDQLLSGVIESGQRFFGADLKAADLSPSFFTRSTGLWAGKYSINNYVPNPVLFNMWELMLLSILVALCIFFKFVSSKRMSTLTKRMKNGFIIGCFIPVITSSLNCLINVSWIGYFNGFSITCICVSLILMIYFALEIWRFIEPSHKWSFFFNNEEGYLSFDCHPNSFPGTKFNIWEYLPFGTMLLVSCSLYPLANAGIASPIVYLVGQIIILVSYMKNLSNNEWREDLGLFNFFKLNGAACRVICGIILVVMWSFPQLLTLIWIKIFTWIFVVFYLLDLLLIVGEVISRYVYLILESGGKRRFKEYKPIRLSASKKPYDPQAEREKADNKRKGYTNVNSRSKSNKIHPLSSVNAGQANNYNAAPNTITVVDAELGTNSKAHTVDQRNTTRQPSKKPSKIRTKDNRKPSKTPKRDKDRKKSRGKSSGRSGRNKKSRITK
jgi:hypothetical protein